jgi:hypothetical protein
MGLLKHYDRDGVYLGLTYWEDGAWRAEDRLGWPSWHDTELAARAWLTRRRRVTVGKEAA